MLGVGSVRQGLMALPRIDLEIEDVVRSSASYTCSTSPSRASWGNLSSIPQMEPREGARVDPLARFG